MRGLQRGPSTGSSLPDSPLRPGLSSPHVWKEIRWRQSDSPRMKGSASYLSSLRASVEGAPPGKKELAVRRRERREGVAPPSVGARCCIEEKKGSHAASAGAHCRNRKTRARAGQSSFCASVRGKMATMVGWGLKASQQEWGPWGKYGCLAKYGSVVGGPN
jgi:hypothetical protein